MGRWKIPAIGICVCFLVVIALLTILFVVMNRHPETKTEVSSTDMRILDRVSSVWCGWQEVSSSHPITVYRISGEPIKDLNPTINYRLNYDVNLRWGREKTLKYYLLPGSTVDVGACSDRTGVFVRIFQGIHKWKECQRLRKLTPFSHHDDDSSSSEESDEKWGRKSVKEHGRSNYGWYPPDCEEATASHEIPSERNGCKGSIFNMKIGNPDTYVFSLQDYHSSADESVTTMKVTLNRTVYDTKMALLACHDVSKCDVPLSFGSNERAVVAIAKETNAGAVTYVVLSTCRPRVFFFIFLFTFIPLLLLLCIGCVIFCFRRRNEKKATVKYIQVTNNEQVNAPRRPLLSGPEVTIYSRADRYQRPPVYPESTAPPPYTFIQSKNEQMA